LLFKNILNCTHWRLYTSLFVFRNKILDPVTFDYIIVEHQRIAL